MVLPLIAERQWNYHSLAQIAKKLIGEIRVGWSRVDLLSIIENLEVICGKARLAQNELSSALGYH